MVSLYHPGSPFTVYCSPCWIGDGWDAMDFGKEYDFAKPFFAQYRELLERVPRRATRMTNSPTSRYCDSVVDCKNCYMVFGGIKAEDCLYGSPVFSKNCVDSDIVFNGDHAYETMSAINAFNTKFVYFSDDCMDSSFLFDCKGCTSCFGCVNLRNRQYFIFNKQYSKEEYKEQMKYWDIGSYAKLNEARKKFDELYFQTPMRFSIMTNAIDSTGDDMKNVKNCKTCFIALNGVENCKYIFGGGLLLKDSYDITSGGDKSQLAYESIGFLSSDHVKFVNDGNTLRNVEYAEMCFNSSNLFGCAAVKHKQYVILNKQYSPEEYERITAKIKIQMTNDKEYGEYPPIALSTMPYNGSWAYERYPLSKEEALAKGYQWYDREVTHYTPDIKTEELPDHVKDTADSLANKIIECAHRGECSELCTTAFRIIPEELAFYKNVNVALPRLCPNCRHFQRIAKRNPYNLWHRKCMNPVRSMTSNGMNPRCPNEFETAIAPERREIVYCEQCYKAEFL